MAETGTALTRADPNSWNLACAREPIIRALASLPKITRKAWMEASEELELSKTQIFELVSRYRENPVTSALLDRPAGFPKGRRRLDPDLDKLIEAKIESFFLARPKPNVSQLMRSIAFACQAQGRRAPSRKAVEARIAGIERDGATRAREGCCAGQHHECVSRTFRG